jgi:PAS domain S-box-containing protein
MSHQSIVDQVTEDNPGGVDVNLAAAGDDRSKGPSIPIRVLILEDRPEDAELMVHELRRSWFAPAYQRMETEADYLAQLKSPPDVILSDYRMPQLDAPRALELLQALGLDIPFIVVSGAIGEDLAVAMMRQGATDYLLKDRLRRLGPAVRRALAERQLREDKRQAEQALRASDARFFSFMNHSPALAFIKNGEGQIVYMNNTCEQVWNMTLSQCEGKLDSDLWPAEEAARLRAQDLSVLESGQSSHVIEELSLPGGGFRHLLTYRFPFADAAGSRILGGISVDITEQMHTERALAAALLAKETLLKEVHHRVKNNLQIISSLLNMQAELLPDPSQQRAFRESQQRVESMAMIHERLCGHEDLDLIDFQEYVESLTRDLFHAYSVDSDRVRVRLELEPVSLELNQAIPCGLILNELLTNALKYAFPGTNSGEILVALSCDADDRVTLSVADDGLGMLGDADWKESQSLGLGVLTRQLAGTLERKPRSGVDFCLVFQRVEDESEPIPRPAQSKTSRVGR